MNTDEATERYKAQVMEWVKRQNAWSWNTEVAAPDPTAAAVMRAKIDEQESTINDLANRVTALEELVDRLTGYTKRMKESE